MGEEYTIGPGMPKERHLAVRAHGTVPIERIEIIKNGHALSSRPGNRALDVEFVHSDPEAQRETDCYYAHVVQEDGEQAWSSPIWVSIMARTC